MKPGEELEDMWKLINGAAPFHYWGIELSANDGAARMAALHHLAVDVGVKTPKEIKAAQAVFRFYENQVGLRSQYLLLSIVKK